MLKKLPGVPATSTERQRQGRNPRQLPAHDDSLRKETLLELDRDTEALRDEARE